MSDFTLRGLGVALVTPFEPHTTEIDFTALERIIEHVIAGGADYLVVLGTTAETPTLSPSEYRSVKEFVRDKVAGRLPLVLGMGGNCTLALCERLANEDVAGYSAILSVVPYYNKPSQEGIYQHYKIVSEVSPLPLVLYNVPGRTGVNMLASTTVRLSHDCPNIIGVKEASGIATQVSDIVAGCRRGFHVVSGDDALTLALMAEGAGGVISVVGNAFPREFGEMVRTALKGDFARASHLNSRFGAIYRLMFADGNPAGVKCALSALGFCQEVLRLPLVPVRTETREAMRRAVGLLVDAKQ